MVLVLKPTKGTQAMASLSEQAQAERVLSVLQYKIELALNEAIESRWIHRNKDQAMFEVIAGIVKEYELKRTL